MCCNAIESIIMKKLFLVAAIVLGLMLSACSSTSDKGVTISKGFFAGTSTSHSVTNS